MKKTVHKTRNVGTSFDHLKPSIPTDEEIFNKASDWVNRYPDNESIQILSTARTSYITGYKQALKDLGHLK